MKLNYFVSWKEQVSQLRYWKKNVIHAEMCTEYTVMGIFNLAIENCYRKRVNAFLNSKNEAKQTRQKKKAYNDGK